MTIPTSDLDKSIGDLTATLGDATRRGIYITARQSPEPLTASKVAELFDIHPNVARHHLDRLTEDGYLEIGRATESSGAGRPAKTYQVTNKTIDLHFPTHQHDLLSNLLMRVITEIASDDISAVARRVGRQYGLELAAEIGVPDEEGFEGAVRAVAAAMTGVGFGIAPDLDGTRLLTTHCPFGDTATNHPDVVCALDQGLVGGLMEAIDPTCLPTVTPHSAANEQDCVTEVAITLSR